MRIRAATVFCTALPAALFSSAFAQPLPTDPRLVTGTLDNGLSYIVRQHDNPPGRVEMMLRISTGSLNETEKQRGIAHFTEHMAFNGSEHFKPGTVIDFFQSLGMTFGRDQNAQTGFDSTVYMLSLPDNQPETLQKGMLFLSDVAFKLSLPQKEIDNERGIILEERRTRLGGLQRVQDQWLDQLSPGSLLGKRIPIGVEETINGVQQQDFKDYYSAWYVPSNMTMMVVADMDPKVVVEQITGNFSGGAKVARPKDPDAKIKPADKTRAIVLSDPELVNAQVELIWVCPPDAPTTTVELTRRDLIADIADWCFSRRLSNKVSQGAASFQGGGPSVGNIFHAARLDVMGATGEPSKWKAMLTELATETQRARLYGFTEQELSDAKKSIQSRREEAVKTEPTRSAAAIIGGWNQALAAEEPITSAAQDLEVTQKLLPTITIKEVNDAFNAYFDTTKPVTFSLQLPSSSEVPTEEQLIDIGTKALAAKPEKETEAERPKTLMDKLPESGKIADQADHAASAVTSAWLSNNARVHYRFMDYKKDQVIVSVAIAGGEIQETPDNRGISAAAALAWSPQSTATSTLSSTNIRDLMTGKKVGVGGRQALDAMMLTVFGSPEDIETGMQLAHLLLTDPKVEGPALDKWKEQIKQVAVARKRDIESAFTDVISGALYPPDAVRLRPVEPEQADKITADAATAWLKKVVSEGPIEISIVGDIPKERAMELVQRYFGSLTTRPRIGEKTLSEFRNVKHAPGPINATKSFATQTDKALVLSGFFGVDAKNLRDVRLMNMASQVLSTRAVEGIREKDQLAYSPQVGSVPATEYPGLGLVFFESDTGPAKVPGLVGAVNTLFDSFAKDGPTDEELATVKKQIASTLDKQMREPGFWSTRLTTMDYRTTKLDEILGAPEAYQAFTGSDVKDAFIKYYKPESRFVVSITPETPADAPKKE